MVGMGKFIHILVFLFKIQVALISITHGYTGILISLRITETWNTLTEFSMFGKTNTMN